MTHLTDDLSVKGRRTVLKLFSVYYNYWIIFFLTYNSKSSLGPFRKLALGPKARPWARLAIGPSIVLVPIVLLKENREKS